MNALTAAATAVAGARSQEQHGGEIQNANVGIASRKYAGRQTGAAPRVSKPPKGEKREQAAHVVYTDNNTRRGDGC